MDTITDQREDTQLGQGTDMIPKSSCDFDTELEAAREELDRQRAAQRAIIENPTGGSFASYAVRFAKYELERLGRMTPEAVISARRAEQAGRIQAERERRMYAWQRLIGERGARYAECTFANFEATTDAQERVVESLQTYAIDIREAVQTGRGVVLFGPVGTGKDHLLAALMRKATVQDGLSVAWRSGPELWEGLRDMIGDSRQAARAKGQGERRAKRTTEREYLRPLLEAQILALSDPATHGEPLTSYQAAVLYRLIDRRYSDGRPTWITCNAASRTDLEGLIGLATTDRLVDQALTLPCNWPSYRRPAACGSSRRGAD